MFYLLSKILLFLIKPLNWILAAFLWGLITKSVKKAKWLFLLGAIGLVFFTNPFFINRLLETYEPDPVPLDKLKPVYELAIVLGGPVKIDMMPRDRTYFGIGADRCTQTLELYKAGRVKKILVSGEHGRFFGSETTEGQEMKMFFARAGVPETDLIVEDQAKNTFQNAVYSKAMADSLGYRDILMVTSAFHMPRSKACFEKAGLSVDVFPVDYRSAKLSISLYTWLLPEADCLWKWDMLIKEWVGFGMYWVMGYV